MGGMAIHMGATDTAMEVIQALISAELAARLTMIVLMQGNTQSIKI